MTSTTDVVRILPHWLNTILEDVIVTSPAQTTCRLDVVVEPVSFCIHNTHYTNNRHGRRCKVKLFSIFLHLNHSKILFFSHLRRLSTPWAIHLSCNHYLQHTFNITITNFKNKEPQILSYGVNNFRNFGYMLVIVIVSSREKFDEIIAISDIIIVGKAYTFLRHK